MGLGLFLHPRWSRTSVHSHPSCAMFHTTPSQMDLRAGKIPGSSSRILYDIPCRVCQDHSSGKHYGIFACDGCAGFFKRSIRRSRQYVCKAKSEGTCLVDKTHRNQCRACRLTKCIQAGMNKEAVQHERGPRNSTIRRQMSIFFKDACDEVDYQRSPHNQPNALDLALPKGSSSVEKVEPPASHVFQQNAAAAFLAAQALLPKLPPNLSISLPTAESVCESAARLLFMNVQWAKRVPAFTRLHYHDQLLLLEETWRELFVLGAAQFLLPVDLSHLLAAHTAIDTEQSMNLIQEVHIFQETLLKFKQLQVDDHEYACLRAITLFKTCFDGNTVPSSSASSSSSEVRSLVNAAEVAALQDATQVTLSKYIATAHPTQPFRFGKLLLLLPALRAVSVPTIEELFFRRTIGQIPIERIICDMYKARDL